MTLVAIDVEPALYCGTYAKYNDGSIDGKWLKLADYPDAETFLTACRDLHHDEADPELMFQDFEGFPKSLYGESLSLADLQKIYDWVHLDDDDRKLLDEYLETTGDHDGVADVEAVRDSLFCVLDDPDMPDYNTAMGWYMLEEDFIEAPEHLRPYIDVAALGRDWLMDFSVSSNGYVFEV